MLVEVQQSRSVSRLISDDLTCSRLTSDAAPFLLQLDVNLGEGVSFWRCLLYHALLTSSFKRVWRLLLRQALFGFLDNLTVADSNLLENNLSSRLSNAGTGGNLTMVIASPTLLLSTTVPPCAHP